MSADDPLHRLVHLREQVEARFGGRYTLALVSILVALVAYPATGSLGWPRLIIDVWMFVSLGSLMVSLHERNLSRVDIIWLGALMLGLLLLNLASGFVSQFPAILYLVLLPFAVLFFFRCAWLIVHSIFQEERVNTDMICGAVLAYLLIGIGWSGLYGIIDLTVAEAFYFPENVAGERGAALVYFSFVTMTTLGLGDIQPAADIARTATYLQAVAGVMFGAIFVAAVVGNWKRNSE
jgi:hypothetical protein